MLRQMAASAVYKLSSISSHSFTNLYTVDFINYVKSGGKSLQDEVNILDVEDFDSDEDGTSTKADPVEMKLRRILGMVKELDLYGRNSQKMLVDA